MENLMKKLLVILSMTVSSFTYANQLAQIQKLAGEMCMKSFQCMQPELEKTAKDNPTLADFLEETKRTYYENCNQVQKQTFGIESDYKPTDAEQEYLDLTLACFEAQSKAGCEYFTGEKNAENMLPACKKLKEYKVKK